MRFRTAGTNWEGRRWVLAPGLVVLARQIDVLHPGGHPTDGTVAGKAHDQVNPTSDHRPKPWSGAGIVRAVDAGETVENDAFKMAEAIRLSKDKRVKYVLHEGRMFSSYPMENYAAYTWRPYGGPPHDSHVHISTLPDYDNSVGLWSITEGGGDMPWTKPGDPVENLDDADAVFEYQGTFAPGQDQASYNPPNLDEANDRTWIVMARFADWMMRH